MVRYCEIINEDERDDEEAKEQHDQFLERLRDNLQYYYSQWDFNDREKAIVFNINEDDSVEILSNCHLNTSALSLPYANITVCHGDFIMANMSVKSLKYTPRKIFGEFSCGYNDFTSLVDGPVSVAGNYACQQQNKLESIEGLATEIGGELDFNGCKKLILNWDSFDNVRVGGKIKIPYHVNLPILRVIGPNYSKSRVQVTFNNVDKGKEALAIISKYWNRDDWKKAVVECQYELIKSGFKGNAKW